MTSDFAAVLNPGTHATETVEPTPEFGERRVFVVCHREKQMHNAGPEPWSVHRCPACGMRDKHWNLQRYAGSELSEHDHEWLLEVANKDGRFESWAPAFGVSRGSR